MSVCAVKITDTKIYLASDSQLSGEPHKMIKINGDFAIACTGSSSDNVLFMIFAKNHFLSGNEAENILDYLKSFSNWKLNKTNDASINGSSYLILFKKRAFYCTNWYVKECLEFDAIGSGRSFALTALYLGKSIREAIEVTCALDIYCSLPVRILEIDR